MANHTENIGIGICKVIAEKNNWFFREQPVNDIGIDAHIEYIDSADKPKQLLALQIKTGNTAFAKSLQPFSQLFLYVQNDSQRQHLLVRHENHLHKHYELKIMKVDKKYQNQFLYTNQSIL